MKYFPSLVILFAFFFAFNAQSHNPIFTSANTGDFPENRIGAAYTISATIPPTHSLGTENDEELIVASVPVFSNTTSTVVEEGTTSVVLDIDATDGNGGATDANLTYSISGTDADDFEIDAATGELSFSTAPDWKSPADANVDNIYDLIVTANNGSASTDQNIKVFVFPKTAFLASATAQQLGVDIDGEATDDGSGTSVSLSSDGGTLAIGAFSNDRNGTNSGHVRLYRYNGLTWQQLGSDVEGEVAYEFSGISVSLSADGNIVAIGAYGNGGNGIYSGLVRLYRYNGTTWQQLGSDIEGEAVGDQSGYSVSLSADGSTVAVGAYTNDGNGTDAGHVRLYRYNGTAWQQLGSDIDGEATGDYSGKSVSLSADGSTIAIGAVGNDGNGDSAGHVRLYHYNGSAWQQLGSDIDGEAGGDFSGTSVSLSADGSIVAIGAYNNVENGYSAGHVRLYGYTGSTWLQLGSDIDGEASGDQSGRSVSLSADGSTVAIGAHRNDGNGTDAGHVRLYRYNGSVWQQVGSDIDGEAAADYSGYSVSLSADGSTVAIGNSLSDSNGINAVHVRVFEIVPSLPVFLSSSSTVVKEGTTGVVLDIDVTDVNTDGNFTYSISGADEDEFEIDVATGELSFSTGPDWKNPTDANTDNIYELIVTANNGSATADQNIKVFVFPKTALTGSETARQLGNDIDGEAAYDWSGYAVSLSADGSTVAIGTPNNGGNGIQSGHVRLYRYTDSAWQQLGSDIDGEKAGDGSGSSVSLSADGSTVAIGAPWYNGNGSKVDHVRLYRYDGSDWQQLGSDIDGETIGDHSGHLVSLSADGSTVAIGAHLNDGTGTDAGHVRLYRYNGSAWQQLGSDIDGEARGDWSGWSISLSADGSTVAIGAYYNDGNGTNAGQVRLYRYNGTSWQQLGNDIDGEAAGDVLGSSLSLSADGSIVAIGATGNDGNGTDAGHVRLYQYNGSTWQQLGTDIDGEAAGDYSGVSVSLCADGSTVAIGAHRNDGNGTDAGHVRLYQYNGSAWQQVGSDIDGEVAGDYSGYSIGLSANGSTVAIGAIFNDGNGPSAGHVRVFEIVPSLPVFLSSSSTVVKEGTTSVVLDIDATDGDGGATDANISYSIGGTDADKFEIDVATGELSFSTAPDWKNPADANTDNIYELMVTANNGSATADQNIKVFVFPKTVLTGSETAQQLGSDIDGEAANDNSGISVSLSADGSTIAIGADNNDGNATNAGHVRIYRYNGTVWQQLGSDIDGEAAGDYSGTSVSLSADGSIVAIGAPSNNGNGTDSGHVRLYRYNGSAWQQLGSDIDGEVAGDYSGGSVCLSADGNTVAIGASSNDGNGTDAGHVRLYRYSGSAWQQLGNDIDGEAADDSSGNSISLSADGSIVAIGVARNGGNGANAGHVRLYRYNGSAWQQLGSDIDGEAAGDQSGRSVSLSADGSTVAIGAVLNDGSGADAGHVRLYRFDGAAWQQLGSDIDGQAAGDRSGNRVSLSADGNIVAIGALFNDGNGTDAGHVRLYRYNGSAWQQLGSDIDGEAAGDQSGSSVSLSADGSTVAIGASGNDGNGDYAGHVRVFELVDLAVPNLISSTPSDGATEFGGTTISLTFDANMQKGRGRISIMDASNDSELWSVGVNHPSVSVNGAIVTLDFRRPLPLDKEVYLNIEPTVFKDESDAFYAGISDKTTLNFFTPTKPVLISSTPVDGATEFGATTIALTFDRNMEKGVGVISILNAADDSELWSVGANHPNVRISGATITLDFRRPLPLDKEVYLNIEPGAFKGINGNFFAGISDNSTLNFFTASTPKLVASSPADGGLGFDGTIITLTFDREVFKGSGSIALFDASNDTELWAKGINHPNISINGTEVTLNLRRPLDADKNVYLNIASTAFKDASDLFYSGIVDKTTLNFSTQSSGSGFPASFNISDEESRKTELQVGIYPNPASHEVTIDLSRMGQVPTVSIIDLSGAEVFRKAKVETQRLTVDVSSYSQGVFLITVTTETDEVIRKKMSVIKQ